MVNQTNSCTRTISVVCISVIILCKKAQKVHMVDLRPQNGLKWMKLKCHDIRKIKYIERYRFLVS
jgi:hypothetical protein